MSQRARADGRDHAPSATRRATGTSTARRPRDGDNWQHDSRRAAASFWPTSILPLCATSPTCRSAERTSRTCGRSTTALRETKRSFAMRKVTRRDADLSGVPRPVQEGGSSVQHEQFARSASQWRTASRSARCHRSRGPSALPTRATGLRAHRAVPRGDPRHRRALRARHLSEPDRDHHRRADAGRLRLASACRSDYRHWCYGKEFIAQRAELPARPAWASPTRSSSTPTPASPT